MDVCVSAFCGSLSTASITLKSHRGCMIQKVVLLVVTKAYGIIDLQTQGYGTLFILIQKNNPLQLNYVYLSDHVMFVGYE